MTLVILEKKNGSTRITRAWEADDIFDAANKVAFKNGGWTAPYQLTADDCDDESLIGQWTTEGGAITADEPDAADAAYDFVTEWFSSDAMSCVILSDIADAAEYLGCDAEVLETITNAFA